MTGMLLQAYFGIGRELMNSLISSLPWYFWFVWGFLGIGVFLKYAIWPRKNTPPVPFMWKVSWVICMLMSFLVIATSFIDGTGLYKEYDHFIGQVTVPSILLLFLTLFIGGHQISMRPGFDPRKRRLLHIQTIVCIVIIIFLMWLIGPFIWERYYK